MVETIGNYYDSKVDVNKHTVTYTVAQGENSNVVDNTKDFIPMVNTNTIKTQTQKQTTLIVQNNESIEKIARMVLESRGKDFDYNDILNEIDNIKTTNLDCLDGTKKGFKVGSSITVDADIDVKSRKSTDGAKLDFERKAYPKIHEIGSNRIKEITDKYNLLNKEIPNSKAFSRAKQIYNEFFKEYGNLYSTSMEALILGSHCRVKEDINKRLIQEREECYFLTNENGKMFQQTHKSVKKIK